MARNERRGCGRIIIFLFGWAVGLGFIVQGRTIKELQWWEYLIALGIGTIFLHTEFIFKWLAARGVGVALVAWLV
jgi:hypothetical protein